MNNSDSRVKDSASYEIEINALYSRLQELKQALSTIETYAGNAGIYGTSEGLTREQSMEVMLESILKLIAETIGTRRKEQADESN